MAAALLASTMLFALAAAPAADAKPPAIKSVRVPKANFRAGPSKGEDILFTATRYFPVQVLETKGSWVRVRDFEKEQAWIAKRLLSTTPSAVVRVEKGNVRDEPSIQGEKVDRVEYGEVFRVVDRKGRWIKIRTRKQVLGWVRDDLTWGEPAS